MKKNKHTAINQKINDKLADYLSGKIKSRCMFPECKKYAINSHSISKTSSLQLISENGLLLHPKVKRNDPSPKKNIKFENIGINRASVFRGFCDEHEQLFYDIDTSGIETLRDLFLQIYRFLSKDIFVNDAIMKSERLVFENGFIFNEKFEKSKHTNSYILSSYFHKMLYDFPESNNKIDKSPSGSNVFKLGLDGYNNLDVSILYKELPLRIPVALQKKFTLKKGTTTYETITIILPSQNGTSCIFLSSDDELKHFHSKISKNIDALCLIETLMMLDAEWYTSPSVFNDFSTEKKLFLEKDFRYVTERNLSDLYDISIFDSIRESLMDTLDDSRKEIESRKLNNLPERDTDEKREERLTHDLTQGILRKISLTPYS